MTTPPRKIGGRAQVVNVLSSALLAAGAWAAICVGLDGPQWAGGAVAIVIYFIEVNVPLWRKAAGL